MRGIDNRKLIWILAGLLLVVTAGFAWSLTRGYETKKDAAEDKAIVTKEDEPDQTACASPGTYARLKEVAFEEARRARNADPANLDTLAASSVVRMEDPVVRSRDEDLNVTVCSGRFILELPPGAEAAFGGERRLVADIEYSAQAAVDGSGLVYEIRGAEPIISRLAGFQLRGPQPAIPPETQYAEAPPPPPAPPPAPEAADAPAASTPPQTVPTPRPVPAPAPRQPAAPPEPERRAERPRVEPARQTARANPSFNCRYARTRGERMVCGSPGLAARDRAMSSLYYSALADADGRARTALRRTRDRFLAYRDRCGSEACVADAYEGRMREIRDIMAEAR